MNEANMVCLCEATPLVKWSKNKYLGNDALQLIQHV